MSTPRWIDLSTDRKGKGNANREGPTMGGASYNGKTIASPVTDTNECEKLENVVAPRR